MRKTRIIATIGPASEDTGTMRQMIKHGMNIARLNFSHGTHESHLKYIHTIRKLSEELAVKIPIIQDLSGPKLRLGEFEQLEIKEGDLIRFGTGGVPVQEDIWKWIEVNQVLLIDDGMLELQTMEKTDQYLVAKVIVGGVLKSRKGVSLPGVKVNLPALSQKDLDDAEFGIKQNVDALALSFVREAADITALREIISQQTNQKISIIAKIETVEALENIEMIVEAADGIMVARGDLGLNIDQNLVPLYQKNIINLCLKEKKPVIVATQMLDSMINNPRPTRAEVSDVANAVIDQASAVMLSGETAFGKYPVKTVETMANIIIQTEASSLYTVSSLKELVLA